MGFYLSHVRSAGVVAAFALLLAACGSSAQEQPTKSRVPQSSALSTTTSAVASPVTTTVAPVRVAGIIVLNWAKSKSRCTIQSLDPVSGSVTDIASFADNTGDLDCNRPGPYLFSSKFDRIAESRGSVDSERRAGWIGPSGTFTPVGPTPTTPDFGEHTTVFAVGFDKRDNFYYRVAHGDSLGANYYEEYFRVPPGSVSNGEFVGSTKKDSPEHGTQFGMLPGGTLGFGSTKPYNRDCNGDSFDPDRQVYFWEEHGLIERSAEWCTGGTPITPPTTYDIFDVAGSPDGEQAVFTFGGTKIFVVDASGESPPKELNAPSLTDLGNFSWKIYTWV